MYFNDPIIQFILGHGTVSGVNDYIRKIRFYDDKEPLFDEHRRVVATYEHNGVVYDVLE